MSADSDVQIFRIPYRIACKTPSRRLSTFPRIGAEALRDWSLEVRAGQRLWIKRDVANFHSLSGIHCSQRLHFITLHSPLLMVISSRLASARRKVR